MKEESKRVKGYHLIRIKRTNHKSRVCVVAKIEPRPQSRVAHNSDTLDMAGLLGTSSSSTAILVSRPLYSTSKSSIPSLSLRLGTCISKEMVIPHFNFFFKFILLDAHVDHICCCFFVKLCWLIFYAVVKTRYTGLVELNGVGNVRNFLLQGRVREGNSMEVLEFILRKAGPSSISLFPILPLKSTLLRRYGFFNFFQSGFLRL